jgi:hypothetical protein
VTTQPEALMASARDLQGIGAAMSTANGAAAARRPGRFPRPVSVISSSGPISHNSCSDTVCRRGWESYGPWDCGGVSAGT